MLHKENAKKVMKERKNLEMGRIKKWSFQHKTFGRAL